MMVHHARSFVRGSLLVALIPVIFLVFIPGTSAVAQTLPALLQAYIDTTYAPPSGNVIAVNAGGDLQAALDTAQPGDTIVLQAGATFSGPFTLPNKTVGSGWIYVQSSGYASLPAPGTRVGPADAANMPKIIVGAGAGGAIQTATGAHHFRFVGIELTPAAGTFVYNVVELGAGETALSALPHDIVFDRCYLHGDPAQGSRRGIAMNAASVAVVDSYLSDFKEVGNDSQALAAWNGAGPFKIVNNYLEGAGENLMFGGSDPSILNLVPSDIEIRQNHFVKPLSWRVGDPSYAGTHWEVKNLLELKNAQRVLIEGNVLEQNWADAQDGFAVLFTVRNSGGNAPWDVVQDVTYRYNIVRHSGSGVNILGYDYTWPSGSQQTKRVSITNNLFDDISGATWGGDGRLFQLLDGTANVTIDHNTGFQDGNIITADGTPPSTGFVYTNTIAPHNAYGVFGSGAGVGTAALTAYFPGAIFVGNVLIGGEAYAYLYPSGNFFPPTVSDVGFMNFTAGDYRLAPSSPYKNAGTDGKDIGADIDGLNAATSGTATGNWTAGRPSAPILVSVQ